MARMEPRNGNSWSLAARYEVGDVAEAAVVGAT